MFSHTIAIYGFAVASDFELATHLVAGAVLIFSLLIAYGDLRIRGGTESGQLEFDSGYGDWGAVCKDGFDDDAGDVACRQLGYVRADDVYTYDYAYTYGPRYN